MRTVIVVLMAVVGILVLDARPGRGEPVTLAQLYARALDQSEEIQSSEEGVRQASEDVKRARSAALPKLTLSGNYTRLPEEVQNLGGSQAVIQPHTAYGAEAKLEQPLFSGGKLRAGTQIARSGVEVAGKDLRLIREQRLLRVAQVFYGLLKAQKNVEIQNRNVERLAEHRRLSELRYKVGEVTESILLRSEAELAGARADLVARQNDVAVATRELQLLTGLSEPLEIVEPPVPAIPSETVSQLREAALQQRDEIQKSRLQERIAEERVAVARSNFFPTVNLEGEVSQQGQDPRAAFLIDRNWFIGGRVEFPIFEGGLRLAEFRQSKSRLEQSRFETARLAKQVDLDVTQAGLTLDAVSRVLESRRDQVRFAQKNYEMVSKQFTFGLATNLDAIDANQALIEAERDAVAATYDRHLAILDVQRSAGVFLSEALKGAPGGEI